MEPEPHELSSPSIEEVEPNVQSESPIQDEVTLLKEEVERLKVELEKQKCEVEKLKSSLQAEKKKHNEKSKQFAKKLKRLKQRCAKKEEEILRRGKAVEIIRKEKKQELLKDLAPTPRAVFEVMLHGGKHTAWAKHPQTFELCLSILFRSTSAYQQLCLSGFTLPHPRTLRNRFRTVLKTTGFCPQLKQIIALRTAGLATHERMVTVSFDGMRLTKGLRYHKETDHISGFEDLGSLGRSCEVANEGIVVMVRSLSLRWKQIMGYFLAKNCMTSQEIGAIIQEAVRMLTDAGLKVIAIVMDQGSTQWKWVDDMGVSPSNPSTIIADQECFILADPPHLLKNLRNHLMTKNISFTLDGCTHTATWEDVKVSIKDL